MKTYCKVLTKKNNKKDISQHIQKAFAAILSVQWRFEVYTLIRNKNLLECVGLICVLSFSWLVLDWLDYAEGHRLGG